ncbi:MAG: hypothetical protein ABFD58_14110 [Anaerolineaceae bacterium]|nr:hypothetical protein [bacterium]
MIVIRPTRMPRIILGVIGAALSGWCVYNLVTYIQGQQVAMLCSLLFWFPISLACISYAAGAMEKRMDEKGYSQRGLLWIRRFLPWQAVSQAVIYTYAKQTFISSMSMMQTFIRLKGEFGEITVEHSAAGGQDWLNKFFKLMQTAAPHVEIIDERTPAGPEDQKYT